MSDSSYEDQLLLIKQALLSCDNESDRENLTSLEKDLLELISLENETKQDEDSELNNELKVSFLDFQTDGLTEPVLSLL
jgi:hypothetical protein